MSDSENKRFLLTVAIPTYNRPKELDRLLSALVPQITPEVEVCIQDDGTNDETQTLVFKHFKGKEDNLIYVRGKKLGVDNAILLTIEHARGEYVWTFGDDDLMAPGAIEKVTSIVKKYPDITFVWVNFQAAHINKPVVDLGGDRFFRDRNEFLTSVNNRIGLLSTLILKKSEAMSAMPLAKENISSWWSLIILALEVLSKKGRFYFLQGPYITAYPTPEAELKAFGFHDLGFQGFGVNFYNAFELFRGKFDRKAVRRVLKLNFGSVWRGVIMGELRGAETTRGKVLKMIKLYWSYPECWIAAPLFLMPKPVLSFLYRAYKKVVKKGYRE